MAKLKDAVQDTRPHGNPNSWARTPGTLIAGEAALAAADKIAAEMESKWGCDRLRLLVSTELREKFDRQRYLLNQAIWHGELEDVRRESKRMVAAYMALDGHAEAAGARKLDPDVMEAVLADGSVAAIVASTDHAKFVRAEGRQVAVYTLEEIGRMLSVYHQVTEAKHALEVIGGATVTEVRRSIPDPLDGLRDSNVGLDDPIDDVGRKEVFA